MSVPDASAWLQCQQRIFHKFRFLHIWMASGDTYDPWDRLLIFKIREFVESLRSDSFDLTGVRWGVYMVGPTTSKAKPTIVFSEGHTATRDILARMLKESELMTRDFQGFAVVSMKSAPIPTTFVGGEETHDVVPNGLTSDWPSETFVYIVLDGPVLGARIYWRFQNGLWRYARTGAILSSSSAVYCLTAAHAFDPRFEYDSSTNETGASETTALFGLDDFSPDDDSDDMLAERTSRGSVTPQKATTTKAYDIDGIQGRSVSPRSSLSLTASASTGSTRGHHDSARQNPTQVDSLSALNTETETHGFEIQDLGFNEDSLAFFGRVLHSSSTSSQLGLDYALIQIHESWVLHLVHQQVIGDTGQFPTQAALSPGSGPISIIMDGIYKEGVTRGMSFYKIYGNNCRSQELWTIETGGLIDVGDSGSCVVSRTSGELLGHIVEANTKQGFAYMIPAYQVLIDLSAQVRGLKISLGLDDFRRTRQSIGEPAFQPLYSSGQDHHALDTDSYSQGSLSKQSNPEGIGDKSNLVTESSKGLMTTSMQRGLDVAFRRRKSGFFKVGKVFKAPWPDISGYEGQHAATVISEVGYGENIYTRIRWFVVVKTGPLSSSCLPILTYGGRGVSGSHLNRSHHAVIYTGDIAPQPNPDEMPLPGERPLGTSIKVVPKKSSDKLDLMARINFSKVYPVEHNVKVYDFGQVHPFSQPWLLYQFKTIFDLSDLPSGPPREAEKRERESSESDDEEGARGGPSGYGWEEKGGKREESHEEGQTFESTGEDQQLVRRFGPLYEGKGKGPA